METQRMHDIEYDALVERLIENFQPARQIWPVNVRLFFWLTLDLAILVLVALVAPRVDLSVQLLNPQYLLQLAAFVLIGSAAAWLALRTAIPGREATRAELILIWLAAMILVVPVLFEPAGMDVTLGRFIQAGAKCLVCTVLVAALPWFALFWTVRRGAPLMLKTAGGLIGVAAFCFSFAATRLGCPIDNSLHVLVWHMLPVALGAVLSLLAGAAWLRQRSPVQGVRSGSRLEPQL